MGQSKINAPGGPGSGDPRPDPQDGIDWRSGGIPVSRRFNDPYFSLDGGLAETRHVFLAGNDLPARFGDGFHIAELGFGTGLNLLATVICWQDSGATGRFRFTSFEAFPLPPADIAEALSHMPEAAAVAVPLLAALRRGAHRFTVGPAEVELIEGDARATLPAWTGRADAWFLDGFSPAKNPELWEAGLLRAVAAHSAGGATFATYTAAGHVRRALDAAGFDVCRAPGYGRKRHMSRGRLRPRQDSADG
jgi:tRNA U34 5-methylaminomethyl-2-thiouridine-forming methyltransferase MnmC